MDNTYDPERDTRIDPRFIPFLQYTGKQNPTGHNVPDRETLVRIANSPSAIEAEKIFRAVADAADNEAVAPRRGLRITQQTIQSQPDGNAIELSIIRPDDDAVTPCVYYIHGGGLMKMSCFQGNYQTWGRLLAHQGLTVVMVDFRNCLLPSSTKDVAPFPAGLNDCVSGFRWVREHAADMGVDANRIMIAGDSGGGNLSIATTMQLCRDRESHTIAALYALCPYISGQWPREDLPSSAENNGIFLTLDNNHGAMAYGIDALTQKNPLAWPYFATEADVVDFPHTIIRINEADPLRDEGIEFYRLLLRAGVSTRCVQSMGTIHAAEMLCSIVPDISLACAQDLAASIKTCSRTE